MAQRRFEKKPLYRRVNRTAHGAPCGHGGEARWDRNTKASKRSEAKHAGMGPKHRHGLDYTPLFQFLLKNVGADWDKVHSEAISRLDREEPVYWLVARTKDEARPIVRVGESSYYSGLCIDVQNRLAKVAPEVSAKDIYPGCPCCTYTFNGARVPNAYREETMNKTFRLLSGVI